MLDRTHLALAMAAATLTLNMSCTTEPEIVTDPVVVQVGPGTDDDPAADDEDPAPDDGDGKDPEQPGPDDDPEPMPDATPEPDAMPEPDATPEPDVTPEPDATPDPEPSADPTPPPPEVSWPDTPDDVDIVVETQLPVAGAPGGAACIIKAGEVVWCDAWGLAHVELGVEATPHTPFLVASVSKTVTAVGILKQMETGSFGLDDDATAALSFSVDSPQPGTITWRQLLTHTAGIKDDWNMLETLYTYPSSPDDEAPMPIPLSEAVESYFSAEGTLYGAGNFQTWAPGGGFDYTNMGIALAGLALEVDVNAPFADYMDAEVLEPLGMTRSSFDWADLNDIVVAMPYSANQTPVGYYTFADTPDGALRASAYDLARFAAMLSAGGIYDGVRILEEDSVAQMTSAQTTVQGDPVGLGLFGYEWQGTWWGHDGAEDGATAQMGWRDDGIGYVLLLNGDQDEQSNALYAIEDALIPFAETL